MYPLFSSLYDIYKGHNFNNINESSKVTYFISSTFEDTKFEQDFLLENVFSFINKLCKLMSYDFNIVSMRWGVRSYSNNSHLVSELCMRELYECLNNSKGISYITLQSHRYGYRPFPSVILSDEFNSIITLSKSQPTKAAKTCSGV